MIIRSNYIVLSINAATNNLDLKRQVEYSGVMVAERNRKASGSALDQPPAASMFKDLPSLGETPVRAMVELYPL